MLTVRLPKELEQRLSKLASDTHRSKSFYVNKAIQTFLDDNEDRLIAISRLEEENPRISLEELERRLGLED